MSTIDKLEKENDELREEVLRLQLVEAQLRDLLEHAERIGGFSFNAQGHGSVTRKEDA